MCHSIQIQSGDVALNWKKILDIELRVGGREVKPRTDFYLQMLFFTEF